MVWKWSLDRGVSPAADNEVDDQCRPLPQRRRCGGIVWLSAPRRAFPPSFTLLLPRPSRHGRTNARERANAAAWAGQSRRCLALLKVAGARVGGGVARVVAGCFQLLGPPLAERAGRSRSGRCPRPPAHRTLRCGSVSVTVIERATVESQEPTGGAGGAGS